MYRHSSSYTAVFYLPRFFQRQNFIFQFFFPKSEKKYIFSPFFYLFLFSKLPMYLPSQFVPLAKIKKKVDFEISQSPFWGFNGKILLLYCGFPIGYDDSMFYKKTYKTFFLDSRSLDQQHWELELYLNLLCSVMCCVSLGLLHCKPLPCTDYRELPV